MAKLVVKGTVIKQDIGGVLTPVAQIISFGHDGAESETFECTTIDTAGAGKEYASTGYSEGGSFDFEVFYDPALAGHQSLTDDITTPPASGRDYLIEYTDAASVNTFNAAGIGISITGAMNDGLKASISLKLNQLMVYTT